MVQDDVAINEWYKSNLTNNIYYTITAPILIDNLFYCSCYCIESIMNTVSLRESINTRVLHPYTPTTAEVRKVLLWRMKS
jgi:hypothetical protein